MWDHALTHGGIQNLETDYNFGVVCSYRDPFTRQVSEATRIQKAINSGVHYDTGGREVKMISLNRKVNISHQLKDGIRIRKEPDKNPIQRSIPKVKIVLHLGMLGYILL